MTDRMGDLAAQDTYDPLTGINLTPQYGEPTEAPSTQGMTLPERYARAKVARMGGILAAPGNALASDTPITTEQMMAPAAGLAGIAMTGGIGGTGPGGFALGAGPVRRVAAKNAAKEQMGELAAPTPANTAGTEEEQVGSIIARPNIIERYVTDPQRIYKPGIYKDPREIAAAANAMVAPEHPALKELFGVTRQDLYDISQGGTRQGNVAPNIWMPAKPKGSYAAENIMNPDNAQRLLDALTEARKYEGLNKGMVPWYVMDPAYQRLEQLVGPERAVAEYNKFNNYMTPFSASSDVLKEINRGTAARMMAERGQLPDFVKYGGMPVEKRGADFPAELADVIPHLRHAPTHTDPVLRYADTGQHGYAQDTVKIPLYTQASGVPQTGFQTAWPVPDAHFTRAVGMSDVRKNAGPGDYMGGSEYRTFSPWFRQNVAQPLGLEGVPTQALTWGTFAPQTGVKTPIGAGKLELISQRMWERAKQLGVDPHLFRDRVLLGQEHAELDDNARAGREPMGSLAAMNAYG
jgi:hypothetical protein